MHYLCEPYFHAINCWMAYDDETIFRNRIRALDAIVRIISSNDDLFFGIAFEVHDTVLLPAVIPTAGVQYQRTFDKLAFKAAETVVKGPAFQIAGLYFQSNLLKVLALANFPDTTDQRKIAAFNALRQLFRLPQAAGRACLRKGSNQEQFLPELSGDALVLYEGLIDLMPHLREEVVDAINCDVGMNDNDDTNEEDGADADESKLTPERMDTIAEIKTLMANAGVLVEGIDDEARCIEKALFEGKVIMDHIRTYFAVPVATTLAVAQDQGQAESEVSVSSSRATISASSSSSSSLPLANAVTASNGGRIMKEQVIAVSDEEDRDKDMDVEVIVPPPAAVAAPSLTRFETLVHLLCECEDQRNASLLQILTEDIKATITSSENVFIKLFNSTVDSVYSKSQRMSALSRNGFDLRAKTATGFTPLEWVVEHLGDESLEILTSLIPGNDVNVAYAKSIDNINDGMCDQFLLLTAARRGKLGFVQALLAGGANLNLPDIQQQQQQQQQQPVQTLAHAAAAGGHYSILKLLIENNADVKKPFRAETPLMAAAAAGEGHPVSTTDKPRQTLLFYVTFSHPYGYLPLTPCLPACCQVRPREVQMSIIFNDALSFWFLVHQSHQQYHPYQQYKVSEGEKRQLLMLLLVLSLTNHQRNSPKQRV